MQSSVKLLCVDPEHVAGVWPLAKPLIKSAFDRTRLGDFSDTERDIFSGMQLLWLAWNGDAIEAAATTQLVNIGDRKICVLVACGGCNRGRWLPLLDAIENYARNEGCEGMRIYGRKGWERALNGYKSRFVILEKGLH